MKRIVALLLPALFACSANNTVASDDRPAEERLAAQLDSSCASICAWAAQCPPPADCDCSGDRCICASSSFSKIDPATCPSDCKKALSQYQGKGADCASAGLGILTCLSQASCSDLEQSDLCQPSEAARSTCQQDSSTSPTGPTSGTSAGSAGSGPTGSGGSSSTGSGSAGSGATGTGGTGSSGAPITCQFGYGAGVAGSANSGGSSHVSCEQAFESCSDGHSYYAVCVVGDQNTSACSCFVDGTLQGSFEPTVACPDAPELDTRCAWPLITP